MTTTGIRRLLHAPHVAVAVADATGSRAGTDQTSDRGTASPGVNPDSSPFA